MIYRLKCRWWTGLITMVFYFIYLIPIGLVYTPFFANEPLPSPFPFLLIGVVISLYAFLISLIYSLLRWAKNLFLTM
jgi:hypothetical protein